jgi:type I restriction enzyme S subunit
VRIDDQHLPSGWCLADIGSLGNYLNGRGFKKAEWSEHGRPIIRIQNLTGSSEKFNYFEGQVDPRCEVEPGDLLMSWAATLGAFVWQGPRAVLNQHIFKVDSFIERRFHYFILLWALDALYRKAHGSGMVHVTKGKFEGTPVLLPPLPEQHRIVEAIESYLTRLDDAMATLERVQRNLQRYRASALKSAVEGRLVPTEAELARAEGREYEPASVLLERILVERRCLWEEAELEKMKAKGKVPKNDKWKAMYVEPVGPDTSELPELPQGWCWASMPQLGELSRGKSKHRPRNDPRLLGGPYPFIQTGDVRHSGGFITEHASTYSEFGLAQSRLWPSGTLCITIAANIAETGILSYDACFPDSVVGFLPTEEPTLVRFTELFFRTAKQELERYAPATAQKNINLEVLSAISVPLPPLAEQSRIVSEIDRLFSVARSGDDAGRHNVLRLARLRQSILKWAFEGRLVDQDLSDEPAEVLLKRIRAERAAANGKKQPRPRPVNTSSASA